MKVAVLMGSANDDAKMAGAKEMLERFGIECDVHVMSAHRNPAEVSKFATGARDAGYAVLIGGAGVAAHLAGVLAAHTSLPVIGVPLSGGIANGLDALLATVQMPSGIPVATVAVDGSKNAGILAAQIIAVSDPEVAKKLDEFKAGGAR
ncbi:MAG TPA: 5-(carboxyamino)imidazole ribonucleotide mutase [Acidimicrobiales bacterium]|nr:5-(carboxyamino)imidazole ribonucleotide mutase [Acidimicrobiales bacterium]